MDNVKQTQFHSHAQGGPAGPGQRATVERPAGVVYIRKRSRSAVELDDRSARETALVKRPAKGK